jgi:3-oxoadipate enol-lactonase
VCNDVIVSNADARIDARIAGDGEQTVVLIHGFPLSKAMWDSQISALSACARVVAIDLRGMGASSVPPGPYLMETLAGDVAAVLDALDVRTAALVGHSLGGYVALAFARMYIERLERLALVCSRIGADTPERAAMRRQLADDAEHTNSNARIIENMSVGTLAPRTRERHPEIVRKFREIAEKNDPRGLAAMLRGMAMRDGSEDIAGDVDVPVLVVAGADDPLVGEPEARATAAAFPAGRLVCIEGSGHVPTLEAPDKLSACLVQFIGE